jgi:hypothetical protein
MAPEYIQLLIVKDEIGKQDADTQAKIQAAADEIRSIIKRDDGIGMFAVALVGSEVAASTME